MMQQLTNFLSSINVWVSVLIVDASVCVLIFCLGVFIRFVRQILLIVSDDDSDFE